MFNLDILKTNSKHIKRINKGFPELWSKGIPHKHVNSMLQMWNKAEVILNEKQSNSIINLAHGNPCKINNTKFLKNFHKDLVVCEDIFKYPNTTGSPTSLDLLSKYVNLRYNISSTTDNIIITTSTTNAFNLLCQTICRPHDVIIIPAPTYGVFCYIPERYGIEVNFLKLNSKDNWKLNINALENEVIKINAKLKIKAKKLNLNYIPRVCSLLIINPHNPLGKYYTQSEEKIMIDLCRIAEKYKFTIVEDLIYDGTQYNNSTFKSFLSLGKENVVGLIGLSKSYGLASTRAGFVVANKFIINGLRNVSFHNMDSSSILQSKILESVFKTKLNKLKKFELKTSKVYQFNLHLVECMLNGLDSIENNRIKNKIVNLYHKYINKAEDIVQLNKGIHYIKFVEKTIPDSGFFITLDFSELKNKSFCGILIKSENDLLKLCINFCKFKFLCGQTFAWPDKNQLIARITLSCDPRDLILAFANLNKIINNKGELI